VVLSPGQALTGGVPAGGDRPEGSTPTGGDQVPGREGAELGHLVAVGPLDKRALQGSADGGVDRLDIGQARGQGHIAQGGQPAHRTVVATP